MANSSHKYNPANGNHWLTGRGGEDGVRKRGLAGQPPVPNNSPQSSTPAHFVYLGVLFLSLLSSHFSLLLNVLLCFMRIIVTYWNVPLTFMPFLTFWGNLIVAWPFLFRMSTSLADLTGFSLCHYKRKNKNTFDHMLGDTLNDLHVLHLWVYTANTLV